MYNSQSLVAIPERALQQGPRKVSSKVKEGVKSAKKELYTWGIYDPFES